MASATTRKVQADDTAGDMPSLSKSIHKRKWMVLYLSASCMMLIAVILKQTDDTIPIRAVGIFPIEKEKELIVLFTFPNTSNINTK